MLLSTYTIPHLTFHNSWIAGCWNTFGSMGFGQHTCLRCGPHNSMKSKLTLSYKPLNPVFNGALLWTDEEGHHNWKKKVLLGSYTRMQGGTKEVSCCSNGRLGLGSWQQQFDVWNTVGRWKGKRGVKKGNQTKLKQMYKLNTGCEGFLCTIIATFL